MRYRQPQHGGVQLNKKYAVSYAYNPAIGEAGEILTGATKTATTFGISTDQTGGTNASYINAGKQKEVNKLFVNSPSWAMYYVTLGSTFPSVYSSLGSFSTWAAPWGGFTTRIQNNGILRTMVVTSATDATATTAAGALAVGGTYVIIVTYNGAFSAANHTKIWINGVDTAATNVTGTGTHERNDADLFVGNATITEAYNSLNGKIHLQAFGSKELNAQEIADLTANPWQIFAEPSKLFSSTYVPPPTAGAVTVGQYDKDFVATTWFDKDMLATAWFDKDWIQVTYGASLQSLTAGLFTNSNTFYTATLGRGAVVLTQSSTFTSSNTFYAATVSQGGSTQALTASLFTNSNTFYTATLASPITLTATQYANTNTFYAGTLGIGSVSLTAGLYSNVNTFYTATLTKSAVNLIPSLFTNSNTFYSAVLASPIILTATRFDNAGTFYTGTLASSIGLTVTRYDNSNTFYAANVGQDGAIQSLTASLFTNSNQFYNGTISGIITLTASRFDNAGSFYAASVTSSITLAATRFDNTNSFYAASISQPTGVQALIQSTLFDNTGSSVPQYDTRLKFWDGGAWVVTTLKTWNGNTWV